MRLTDSDALRVVFQCAYHVRVGGCAGVRRLGCEGRWAKQLGSHHCDDRRAWRGRHLLQGRRFRFVAVHSLFSLAWLVVIVHAVRAGNG